MVDKAKQAFETKDLELLATMKKETSLTNDLAASTAYFAALDKKGEAGGEGCPDQGTKKARHDLQTLTPTGLP